MLSTQIRNKFFCQIQEKISLFCPQKKIKTKLFCLKNKRKKSLFCQRKRIQSLFRQRKSGHSSFSQTRQIREKFILSKRTNTNLLRQRKLGHRFLCQRCLLTLSGFPVKTFVKENPDKIFFVKDVLLTLSRIFLKYNFIHYKHQTVIFEN